MFFALTSVSGISEAALAATVLSTLGDHINNVRF